MSDVSTHELSGPEKAALVLLSLGSAVSSRLLSGLSAREAGALSAQLRRAPRADAGMRARVLNEFRAAVQRQDAPAAGGGTGGEPRPTASTRAAISDVGADREEVVRPYDLGGLPRVSGSEARGARPAHPARLEAVADVPIRCRARLGEAHLSLAELVGLDEGDVVVVGSAEETPVEILGGPGLRLRGRLVEVQGRRAVELTPEGCET